VKESQYWWQGLAEELEEDIEATEV